MSRYTSNPLFEDREVAATKPVPGNQIRGRIFAGDGINLTGAINPAAATPGPIIEKRYGDDAAARFGLGLYAQNTLRLYAAGSAPSAISLGFARPDNAFTDVFTVTPGRATVSNASLCVNQACLTEADVMRLKALLGGSA